MIERMIRLIANTEERDATAEEQLRRLMDRAGAHGQGPAPACEVAVCADPDAQPFVWLSGERSRARVSALTWYTLHVLPREMPSAFLPPQITDPRLAEMLVAINNKPTDLERLLTCLHEVPPPFRRRAMPPHLSRLAWPEVVKL